MPKKGSKIDVSEKEWTKIKTEYITTEISYRALAKKFGIGYTRLQTRGYDENWKEERASYKEKLVKKSIDLICDEQAERMARAVMIGDRMLEKVEESLNEIDMMLCKNTVKIKTIESTADGVVAEVERHTEDFTKKKVAIDRAGLKQLSSVLRDLREIGIFRSELDKKEQEARINKLRKDAEEEEMDTTITVTFEGSIGDYAK